MIFPQRYINDIFLTKNIKKSQGKIISKGRIYKENLYEKQPEKKKLQNKAIHVKQNPLTPGLILWYNIFKLPV